MTARRERRDLTLSPLDNRALANLCGPLDANLRQIEAALDVSIAHRSADFALTGLPAHTARAALALERFYAAAEKPLSVDDIQLGLIELATQKDAAAVVEEEAAPLLRTRRTDLHGPPNQTFYHPNIRTTSRSASDRGNRQTSSRSPARSTLSSATWSSDRARAARGRSGRTATILPGDLAQRSIYAAALRHCTASRLRQDRQAPNAARSRSRRSLHAGPHARSLVHHPGQGQEPTRADEFPDPHRFRTR
jgi:hypothetical protein